MEEEKYKVNLRANRGEVNLKQMLDRLEEINSQSLWTPELLREHQSIVYKLLPYQCPECFKHIVKGEEGKDFITEKPIGGKLMPLRPKTRRIHLECKAKREKRIKELQREMKEEKQQIKRIHEEQQSGKRPTHHFLNMVFYGSVSKPDFEKFKEAVKQLAREYNLLPPDEGTS